MTVHHEDRLPSGTTSLRDPGPTLEARLKALCTQLDDAPDAQYRTRARARLVAMAAVRTPAARRPLVSRLRGARARNRPPSRWRGGLTAGLAGVAVGVTGLAGLVAVAAGAQPGDLLYALKRGTEQTQLALAGESRGRTLLELAGTRLDELRTVSDATLARQTLQLMDEQATEGAALLSTQAVAARDAVILGDLAAWAELQSTGLGALRSELTGPARPAYLESAGLLDAVSTRASELSLALDCPSGPATVGADALGPVPSRCPTEPAPVPGTTSTVPTGQVPPAVTVPLSGPTSTCRPSPATIGNC